MQATKLRFAETTVGLPAGSFPFASPLFDVGDARLHYSDEGAGPVSLMLHDNPTWSDVFRHLLTLLRDRFRCGAPDLPGFGLSTAPARYDDLPETHAHNIAAFVDGLALRSFTPVAHDWGIERLVTGNGWCRPVNGDFPFAWFSRLTGGLIGKIAIRRYNAFVNAFVPAGIRRPRVDTAELEPYRRPLSTPDRRMPTDVFPCSILRAHRVE